MIKVKIAIVVPNWNGENLLEECLESLQSQTQNIDIIFVDNGSSDSSVEIVKKQFPKIILIENAHNLGFAGGVNVGINKAIDLNYDYVGLFNNDAVADKNWVKFLVQSLEKNLEIGAIAGKLLSRDGKMIDSTGDLYSIWGLPIARQRDEPTNQALGAEGKVFGATAGACIYRASAIKDVGLFDEKFFAYYEDTDFNFRLQLAGWKVMYESRSIAYHATNSTSSKISGFTTFQTMKNLPILFFKNVPFSLIPKMLPRFFIVYYSVFFYSLLKQNRASSLRGHIQWLLNIPYTVRHRRKIQKAKKVSSNYIYSILYKDLPRDSYKLRALRRVFTGKP